MAQVDFEIEDYLDECDTRYLVRELVRRKVKGDILKDLDELVDEIEALIKPSWPEIKTLADKQKQEWVNQNWEGIKP